MYHIYVIYMYICRKMLPVLGGAKLLAMDFANSNLPTSDRSRWTAELR